MKVPAVHDPEFWAVTGHERTARGVLIGDPKRTVTAAESILSAYPDSAEWLKVN